jgi:hypothetical protein
MHSGSTRPVPRELWSEVFAADPLAMPFQSPVWIDVITGDGRYRDVSRLYELGDGRIGVLPMVCRRSPVGNRMPASYPLDWEAGGLIAHGGVRRSDAVLVFADIQASGMLRVSLRPNPLTAEVWSAACPSGVAAIDRLAHVLDLEGGFESVWKNRFAGSARTGVRKAEKSALTIERDTTGRLLPAFYELYDRSLDRWAGANRTRQALARWQAHRRDPLSKLQRIASRLGEGCSVWVAWHQGVAAASMILVHGPSTSYIRGAMHKEHAGPTRANYMLHKLAIEEACEIGCRYYHMGDSGTSKALAQFKTRFGAAPHPYSEFHVEALPFTQLDRALRGAAKRALGFAQRSD